MEANNNNNNEIIEKEEYLFQNIIKSTTDNKQRFNLFTKEIQKQYELTISSNENSVKGLDWIINILKQAYSHQNSKDDKKRLLQWILKNLIIQVKSLRLKYSLINNITDNNNNNNDNENNNNKNIDNKVKEKRLINKLWEYQVQIIIRLEYLNLKEDLFPTTTVSKGDGDNDSSSSSSSSSNQSSIDNLVSLLQDASFLMDSTSIITEGTTTTNNNGTNITTDSIRNKGCTDFLDKVILKRFLNLRKVLTKIYGSLEISRPLELKKDKNKFNNNNNKGNLQDLIVPTKENIESTLSINLDEISDCNDINTNLKKKRKQQEQLKIEKEKQLLTIQQEQTKIPKDLFKKVNVKKLNHFTMSLSNPEKSFKTIKM
ncbi:hypothetical protein ACTFIZ_012234 [Dictyostelium cf. discoideum]